MPHAIELDERKKQILEAIVRDYLHTAEPVGSRTIWRNYIPELSPATIRNEMADLEELGLIIQPHTSAGRIPSDRGYRYYVNHIMKNRALTLKEEDVISQGMKCIRQDIEDALHNTLRVLSHLLDYASLIATIDNKTRVYSTGVSHMLKQPEFNNLKFTKQFIETLEEEDLLAEIVREYTTAEGITIRIGSENSFREIKNCSVVMSPYKIKNGARGGLGVIGPTRMSYARTTSILEALSRRLETLLEE